MAMLPPGGAVFETETRAPNLVQAAPGFRWMVLQRHGKRPLAVLARALLQANNQCVGAPWWSEITKHETAASNFAASIRHTPRSAEGPAWYDSWLCNSAEAVRTVFHAHDPLWALPSTGSDLAAVQRFRGAWAGLLAAVFGLPNIQRPTSPKLGA